MTAPESGSQRVYKARGLGGSIVYDGKIITLHRNSLTALLMSIFKISNAYGTQVISAEKISSVEIIRQTGFLKDIFPIYFIRFVYPGSILYDSHSIKSAFVHNTILMSLLDNRDFFQLREAMLADMRGYGPSFAGEAPATVTPAPASSLGRIPRLGLSFIALSRRRLRMTGGRRSTAVLASAAISIASVGALALYVSRPGYAQLARLGIEVSSPPWSRSVEVSWIGKDEARYRTSISPTAAEVLEAESRTFIAQAPSRTAETFRLEFAPRLERIATDARGNIVKYGNWTFDWGTSYWLLVDGLKAAANAGESIDQKTIVARVESVIQQKITAQYKETLFPEDQFGMHLRSALEKGVSRAASEINRSCQSINDLFEDAVKAPVQRLFDDHWITDPNWVDGGVAMPVCIAALNGLRTSEARLQQSARLIMTETHVPGIAIARLMRPFITVTIGMLGSATGLTLAAFSLGLPSALLIFPLVTAAGMKLAVTATDLALTSLDEAVNRAPFEAEISAGISTAQAEVLSSSLKDVSETIGYALSVRNR